MVDNFTLMKRVKNQTTEIDCYQDCMFAVHTLLSKMALISGILGSLCWAPFQLV